MYCISINYIYIYIDIKHYNFVCYLPDFDSIFDFVRYNSDFYKFRFDFDFPIRFHFALHVRRVEPSRAG